MSEEASSSAGERRDGDDTDRLDDGRSANSSDMAFVNVDILEMSKCLPCPFSSVASSWYRKTGHRHDSRSDFFFGQRHKCM